MRGFCMEGGGGGGQWRGDSGWGKRGNSYRNLFCFQGKSG